jgi:hypothetical protein
VDNIYSKLLVNEYFLDKKKEDELEKDALLEYQNV